MAVVGVAPVEEVAVWQCKLERKNRYDETNSWRLTCSKSHCVPDSQATSIIIYTGLLLGVGEIFLSTTIEPECQEVELGDDCRLKVILDESI